MFVVVSLFLLRIHTAMYVCVNRRCTFSPLLPPCFSLRCFLFIVLTLCHAVQPFVRPSTFIHPPPVKHEDIGRDVTKPLGAQHLPREDEQRNPIDFRRYLDLVLFLCFAILFLSTLFMRRNVREANLVREATTRTFLREATVPTATANGRATNAPAVTRTHPLVRSETGRGRYVSGMTSQIKFNDISSLDMAWQWLEGPLRSILDGSGSGQSALIPTPDHSWTVVARNNFILGNTTLYQVRTVSHFREPSFSIFRPPTHFTSVYTIAQTLTCFLLGLPSSPPLLPSPPRSAYDLMWRATRLRV